MTSPDITNPLQIPVLRSGVAGLPVVEEYKSDGRSRVWRAQSEHGDIVIKRFEGSALRQRIQLVLRTHPGLREIKRHFELASRVPMPGILGWGREGGKFWLASRYRGVSLYNRFYGGEYRLDARKRFAAARAAGELTGLVLAAGYANRDHKASNIIMDDAGRAMLIDVGSARPTTDVKRAAAAMLDLLDRNLAEAVAAYKGEGSIKPTRTDRLRFVQAMVEACPSLGDAHVWMHR